MPVFNPTHEKALGATYTNSFTCVSGHNMTAGHTSDHKWPHWPAEAHYHAKGHGAYPFWLGGGGGSGPPADLEVWWSETKAAEKFYHSACAMTEAGYYYDAPCIHLMTGTQPKPKSYLYTVTEDSPHPSFFIFHSSPCIPHVNNRTSAARPPPTAAASPQAILGKSSSSLPWQVIGWIR